MNRREFTKRILAVASALSCGIIPKAEAKAEADFFKPINLARWERRETEERYRAIYEPMVLNDIVVDHVYLGHETERVYGFLLVDTNQDCIEWQAGVCSFPPVEIPEGFRITDRFVTIAEYKGEKLALGSLTIAKRIPADGIVSGVAGATIRAGQAVCLSESDNGTKRFVPADNKYIGIAKEHLNG